MVKTDELVKLVCEAIEVLQEINGSSLHAVTSVPSIADNRAISPESVQLALQFAVKLGMLHQTKDGKYKLKLENKEERRDESKPVKDNQILKTKGKSKSSPIDKRKAVQKARIKSEPHPRRRSTRTKRCIKYQRKTSTLRRNKRMPDKKNLRKSKFSQHKAAGRRNAIRSEQKYRLSQKMITLPYQLHF